jgi:hypothetical protein
MKTTNRKAIEALAGQPHRIRPYPRLILGGLLVQMTPEAAGRWNAGETTDHDLRTSKVWVGNDDGTGKWITLRRATNARLEPMIAAAVCDSSVCFE